MTCCQDRRLAARQAQAPSRPASSASGRPAPASSSLFEYVGQRAIQVTGPSTGAIYRFARHGARVAVHGADAPALTSVPGLRPAR